MLDQYSQLQVTLESPNYFSLGYNSVTLMREQALRRRPQSGQPRRPVFLLVYGGYIGFQDVGSEY